MTSNLDRNTEKSRKVMRCFRREIKQLFTQNGVTIQGGSSVCVYHQMFSSANPEVWALLCSHLKWAGMTGCLPWQQVQPWHMEGELCQAWSRRKAGGSLTLEASDLFWRDTNKAVPFHSGFMAKSQLSLWRFCHFALHIIKNSLI